MLKNKIIVILGRKGEGKTTMCRYLMKDLDRYIAYDPIRQFEGGVKFEDREKLRQFVVNNYHTRFKAIYQPILESIGTKEDEEKALREFEALCLMIQHTYNSYFVIDEIDMYTSANKCPPVFKNLVMRGRHRAISIICTTRRHTETSRHLTAQADIIISFQQQEPNDIRYLSQFFGEKAGLLPTLKPYHYIKYENGSITMEDPVKV